MILAIGLLKVDKSNDAKRHHRAEGNCLGWEVTVYSGSTHTSLIIVSIQ